jgi:hypothetical protein
MTVPKKVPPRGVRVETAESQGAARTCACRIEAERWVCDPRSARARVNEPLSRAETETDHERKAASRAARAPRGAFSIAEISGATRRRGALDPASLVRS